MKRIPAKEALETMCYTSERHWDRTTYTISDARYPEYNGMDIDIKMYQGKTEIYWTKPL